MPRFEREPQWFWRPTTTRPERTVGTFGDGGVLDNTGILALLARRILNIIVFINCETPIWQEIHDRPWRIRVDPMLPPMFGFQPFGDLSGYEKYPSDSTDPKAKLKLFSADAFLTLITNLHNAYDAGQTLMWRDDYEIQTPNSFGIDYGTDKVNILWVCNNRVDAWQNRIPDPAIQHYLAEGQGFIPRGPLANFPNFSTGFEDVRIWDWDSWKKLGDLTPFQVNLLADLGHWNIATDQVGILRKPNCQVFRDMFPA